LFVVVEEPQSLTSSQIAEMWRSTPSDESAITTTANCLQDIDIAQDLDNILKEIELLNAKETQHLESSAVKKRKL